MRLPEDLAIIHQPVRLGVMAVLHRTRRVRLSTLRDALAVTDGNLATHIGTLEEAGFLQTERSWSREGRQVFVQLTPQGTDAVLRYAKAMREWLASLPTEAT
jgi:DNA-binding MarR family transcriptional regulator